MEIRPANLNDIAAINEIIEHSKSFWDYHPDYLQAAIPIIQTDSNWLSRNEGYVLVEDNIFGFIGIELSDSSWYLEHLWVMPFKIGKGFGKRAMNFIMKEAKLRGVKEVRLLPDPPAEGFYLKLGACLTGKEVQSRVTNGPTFREMIFKL